MKKAIMLLRVLLCLILCQSCNPEFEPEKSENRTESVDAGSGERLVTSSEFIELVKIDVQASTKPEKYLVYFSWPKLLDTQKLRIRMDQVLSITKPSQVTFSHEVGHNQTLTYHFDLIGSDNISEKTFSKVVKIPRDFVVRPGQNAFFENSKIVVNRFFISKDTVLTTNGFNIEIVTQFLNSEGGVIQTHPEGSKAELDQPGKSGGFLVIKSEIARGDLKVYMRGQYGGNGSKGPAFTSRAQDGSPAEAGNLFCECTGRNCLVSRKMDHSNKLQLTDIEPFGEHCACEPVGSNATAGVGGLKGNKGLSAQNGGNSGELKVLINDGKEFFIETFSSFGGAGSPGEGGDGQPGGIGGSGKTSNQRKDCRGWAAGHGSTGPVGDPGDPAKDGKLEMTCISIASENRNDCF